MNESLVLESFTFCNHAALFTYKKEHQDYDFHCLSLLLLSSSRLQIYIRTLSSHYSFSLLAQANTNLFSAKIRPPTNYLQP